jgi:hypothetical protein
MCICVAYLSHVLLSFFPGTREAVELITVYEVALCDDGWVSFRKTAKRSLLLNMKLYFYLNYILKCFLRETD